MHLVLDSSIVIELERENEEIMNKIEELKIKYPAQPRISFMTYFEVLEGIDHKSEKNKAKAKLFIELIEVIQTTKVTAYNLVILRKNYELPLSDLIIAAHVWESKGILVTRDKDFERINEIDKIII